MKPKKKKKKKPFNICEQMYFQIHKLRHIFYDVTVSFKYASAVSVKIFIICLFFF